MTTIINSHLYNANDYSADTLKLLQILEDKQVVIDTASMIYQDIIEEQLYYWNNKFYCIYDACNLQIPKIDAKRVAKYIINDWNFIYDMLRVNPNKYKVTNSESYFVSIIRDNMFIEDIINQALVAIYPQLNFNEIDMYMSFFRNVDSFVKIKHEYYENIIGKICYHIDELTKSAIEEILASN